MIVEKKRNIVFLFATLIVVIIAMAIAAAPVHAADKQTQPLDFTDPATPVTGPGWSWDAENNVLTLDQLDMDLTEYEGDYTAGIILPKKTDRCATVILNGKGSKICIGGTTSSNEPRSAILSEGDLLIQYGGAWQGELEIQATDGANGIWVSDGSIKLEKCKLAFDGTDPFEEKGHFILAEMITVANSVIESISCGSGLKTPETGGIKVYGSTIYMYSERCTIDTGTKGMIVENGCSASFETRNYDDGVAVQTRGPILVKDSTLCTNLCSQGAVGLKMLEPSSQAFNNDHFTFQGVNSMIDLYGARASVLVEDHTTGDKEPVFNYIDLQKTIGGELKSANEMVESTMTYAWSFEEENFALDCNGIVSGASRRYQVSRGDSTIPSASEDPDEFSDPNDIRIWHKVNMKPGESYDATDAKWNTTVFITKAGNYWLSGKSNNVRVVIRAGGVNLFLKNELHLDCGIRSFMGTRTAAINMAVPKEDVSNTVKLISEANAKVYFAGYLAPGIRQDGKAAELVFETADPDHPGEIEAQGGELCAGIGGIDYAKKKAASTGNITFNSGNIIAIGGLDGAGIGGGSFGGVDGITINGGNIEAYGKGAGASIGGGSGGNASNIQINGGTVYAERKDDFSTTTTAAVIGSGGDPFSACNVNNIIITGGNVKAVGIGSTMIGAGGFGSTANNIVIKGGTVYAKSEDYKGAEHYSPAIGSGECGKEATVSIEGGDVTAIGNMGAAGIGAYGNSPDQKLTVTISGGTVHASAGKHVDGGVDYDIGMDNKVKDENVKVIISGGSVYAGSVRNAQNTGGIPLHRVDVGFDGFNGNGAALTDPVFSYSGYHYGATDIRTLNHGKVYFWLPNADEMSIQKASVDGKKYTGNIKFSSTSGSLQPTDGDEEVISGSLIAKMTAKGKKALVISWSKLNGAAGYDIFLAKCGNKENRGSCKLVKTVKGSSRNWTKSGLKAKTAYRVYVKAFILDAAGEKTYVDSSPLVHAFTSGVAKQYTNPKSVTVKKSSVKLAAGKTTTIKASVKKLKKGKKLIPKKHASKLRYMSTNTMVATVSRSGKIKAVAPGSCYIYVYAANGVSKKVSVKVTE